MDRSSMDRALQGAPDTREVILAPGALAALPAVLERCLGDGPAMIVADDNTYSAAGREVHERLAGAGRPQAEPLVFPGTPVLHADFEHVLRVETALRTTGALPVAVGSGTINDLTKLAAHRCGRAYVAVATAASVDAYTSFAAAITHEGVKTIDPCPASRALVADLDVLAAAPASMAASGYGDLLGKVVSGADWLLADGLGIEAIHPRGWSLVQDSLASWTADPAGLRSNDRLALERVMEGLIQVGLAMQTAASTWPASGSEHLFSHLWEMEGLEAMHGFKVGLGTLAAASLYECLLTEDLSTLDTVSLLAAWPTAEERAMTVRRQHLDRAQAERAVEETLAKHRVGDAFALRLQTVRQCWPELRARLVRQLQPAATLREMLLEAGCPTTPEAIGLNRRQFRESFARARTIRSRYTVLDLAAETGRLEPAVETLFNPGGFWHGA